MSSTGLMRSAGKGFRMLGIALRVFPVLPHVGRISLKMRWGKCVGIEPGCVVEEAVAAWQPGRRFLCDRNVPTQYPQGGVVTYAVEAVSESGEKQEQQ